MVRRLGRLLFSEVILLPLSRLFFYFTISLGNLPLSSLLFDKPDDQQEIEFTVFWVWVQSDLTKGLFTQSLLVTCGVACNTVSAWLKKRCRVPALEWNIAGTWSKWSGDNGVRVRWTLVDLSCSIDWTIAGARLLCVGWHAKSSYLSSVVATKKLVKTLWCNHRVMPYRSLPYQLLGCLSKSHSRGTAHCV